MKQLRNVGYLIPAVLFPGSLSWQLCPAGLGLQLFPRSILNNIRKIDKTLNHQLKMGGLVFMFQKLIYDIILAMHTKTLFILHNKCLFNVNSGIYSLGSCCINPLEPKI